MVLFNNNVNKKDIKHFLTLILIMLILVSLTACAGSDKELVDYKKQVDKGENTTGGGNVRPTETNMLVSNDFILIILDTFSLIGNQDTVIGAEIESGFVSKKC